MSIIYELINKVMLPAERAHKEFEYKEAAYEASKQENVDIVKRAKGDKLKVAQEKQEALISDLTKAKKIASSAYILAANNSKAALPKLFKNIYITFNAFFKNGKTYSNDMKSYITNGQGSDAKGAAGDDDDDDDEEGNPEAAVSTKKILGLNDAVTDFVEKEMQYNAVLQEFSGFLGTLKKETEDMKNFSTVGVLLKYITEIMSTSTRLIHELSLAADQIESIEDTALVLTMNVNIKINHFYLNYKILLGYSFIYDS